MSKKAFTLVELIVVITILAVLATVAFISFQWYALSARDSTRLADLNSITKVLELFNVKHWKYPNPDVKTNITYSGSTAWTQWVFGISSYSDWSSMSNVPVDPVTGLEYAYSVTAARQEYSLAAVLENPISSKLSQSTFAWTQEAQVHVKWNYNGKFLKVRKNTSTYLLWVPSILASDITSVELETILVNERLVYKGYKNLPASYSWSVYNTNPTDWFPFWTWSYVANDLILFMWDTNDLVNDPLARTEFFNNLQKSYSWSEISWESDIAELLSVDSSSSSAASNYVATALNNSLKTKIAIVEVVSNTPLIIPETPDPIEPITVNFWDITWDYTFAMTPDIWNYDYEDNDYEPWALSHYYSLPSVINWMNRLGFVYDWDNFIVALYDSNEDYYSDIEKYIATSAFTNGNMILPFGVGNELTLAVTWLDTNNITVHIEYNWGTCAIQPSYINANYYTSWPIITNTSWQNADNNSACFYSCNSGFSGNDCNTVNICLSQPNYPHATFNTWLPLLNGTAWQNTNSNAGCFYSCDDGFSGNDCNSVNTCALQPNYPNATFVTGSPLIAWESWQKHNSNAGCYYTCNSGFSGNDCNTIWEHLLCPADPNQESDFTFNPITKTITAYSWWPNVIIPCQIWWVDVEIIWESVFWNSINSVILPWTVKRTVIYSFFWANLWDLYIPDSVTHIDGRSFEQAWIDTLRMSRGIIEIWYTAFQYNNITNLDLSNDNSPIIGMSAFEWNPLSEVTNYDGIVSNSYIYHEIWGGNIEIVTYFWSEDSITIPSTIGWKTVTSIHQNAFSYKGITDITIPNTITYIWQSAFAGNDLTNLTIPWTVTELWYATFERNELISSNITINCPLPTMSPNIFQDNWPTHTIDISNPSTCTP